MATQLNRLTFAVTEDIEVNLDKLKKRAFYNRSQSDMIRTLIRAGIKQMQNDPKPDSKTPSNSTK